MPDWEVFDVAMLIVAAFIAVVLLVRLMARRRDQLLDDLSRDAETQRRKTGGD